MSADSQKLCVILGAGASHDVATEGNDVFNLENQPTLANQLFNLQGKPYRHILDQYPGAAYLSSYLGPTIAREPTGMEVALRELAISNTPWINKAFAQIPMYLQHLIAYTTTDYVSRPGAYDQLLIQLFNKHGPNVLSVVMNYDVLLERSLELPGLAKIVSSEDYFAGIVKILKPHGSVNWWAVLSGSREEYNQANITWDKVKSGMESDFLIRSPIAPIVSNFPSVWQLRLEGSDALYLKYGSQRPLFPLITAPMALKTISEFVCPKKHTDAATELLNSCNKFLIVGSSGLDTDMLDLLTSALTLSPKIIHLVNPGDEKATNLIKERYTCGVPAFHTAELDGNFMVRRQAFTDYLRDTAIEELLNA